MRPPEKTSALTSYWKAEKLYLTVQLRTSGICTLGDLSNTGTLIYIIGRLGYNDTFLNFQSSVRRGSWWPRRCRSIDVDSNDSGPSVRRRLVMGGYGGEHGARSPT